MNKFTIKDIENLSGIKAHTIRIWEQRYSFLKPSRTKTNIRYYSDNDLRTILNISMLNKYGFKISNIDKMSVTDILEKVADLNTTEAVRDRIVNELIQLMIELDSNRFEKVIDKQIALNGIEKVITKILFPFFERIGILWQTGHINPAQEHLITNITRQKIIVGIDQVNPVFKKEKTFLLFLPEREHHELGLLFVCYLLKKHGIEVCYLGANVPLKDAGFVSAIKKPDYIYLHLTTAVHGYTSEKYIKLLSESFPKTKIIISGFIVHSYKKAIPRNIQFIDSLSHLSAFISAL
jgi:DNA-binding transcriptional MerR regulator/methylmalonyl-CoA mutase cobalamin-binding subunit